MSADFGTGLDMTTDLPLRWSFASGPRNLANAIARRLITQRGTLVGAPDYGFDVRQYILATLTRAQQSSLQGAIARECEKDERVLAASVTATINAAAFTLTLAISLSTADGPFSFVLSVGALTVQILGDL